jgi:hypothetical protein
MRLLSTQSIWSVTSQQLGIPPVVAAAASLGTLMSRGGGFVGSIVYSMQATKSFATGEAGLIYSVDSDRFARLRTMSNFGFGELRSATVPGMKPG